MSPLATWPISWAMTASASSRENRSSKPSLTATRALFLFQPVAKALLTGLGKIPTSGMPMPAACAWRATVSTNHCSRALRGVSIMRVRVLILAIFLDSSRLTTLPAMPNTKQNSNKAFKFRSMPLAAMYPLKPSSDRLIEATMMMARLVSKKSAIRMCFIPPCAWPVDTDERIGFQSLLFNFAAPKKGAWIRMNSRRA